MTSRGPFTTVPSFPNYIDPLLHDIDTVAPTDEQADPYERWN